MHANEITVKVSLDDEGLALVRRVTDENKRLQSKLDRATAKIAEMVRERDEWKAKSEAAEAVARHSIISDHKIIELCRDVINIDTVSALIAVGETIRRLRGMITDHRSKLDAVAKIVGRP